MERLEADRLAALLSAAFAMREDSVALYAAKFEQVFEIAPLEQAIMDLIDSTVEQRPPTIGKVLERMALIKNSTPHHPPPIVEIQDSEIDWEWRRRKIAELRASGRQATEGSIGRSIADAMDGPS